MKSGPFFPRRPVVWAFGALVLWTAWQVLDGPLLLHGDAREYILQTQSVALRGQLRMDTAAAAVYWNRTNPFDVRLGETREPAAGLSPSAQAGGGFGGLYPDRAGAYRYYHAWSYSLVVAPLYALLHLLHPEGGWEYHAFRLMNLLFLLLPILVAARRAATWPLLAVVLLTLLSPLIPYTDWAHPELFCWALILLSFLWADCPRLRWITPVLLGAAASQNPPIFLFFPAHGILLARSARPFPWRASALSYGLGLATGLSSLLYFHHHYGVWNLIAALGFARAEYSSLDRILHLFLSPLTGAFWFFPAAFLFFLFGVRRGLVLVAGVLAIGVVGAAWLSTATLNFNAGQIGAARYAVWLLAPMTAMSWRAGALFRDEDSPRRTAAFGVAVALAVSILLYFGTWRLADKEIRPFGGCWRARPEVARIFRFFDVPEDPETFVENMRGSELPSPRYLFGVYLWNLGQDRSLWLIPEATLAQTDGIAWEGSRLPGYTSRPPNDSLFFRDGRFIRLAPARATNFLTHPVLGRYVTLRLDCAVQDLFTDMPVSRQPGRAASRSQDRE